MHLFHYFFRHPKDCFFVLFNITVLATTTVFVGIATTQILNWIVGRVYSKFILWCGILLATYFVRVLFSYLETRAKYVLIQKIDTSIRMDVADTIAKRTVSSFHKESVDTYTSWLSNDIQTINSLGVSNAIMICQQLLEILMSCITLAAFHYSLAITAAFLAVLMFFLPKTLQTWMSKETVAMTRANERFLHRVSDVLSGFDTLSINNLTSIVPRHVLAAAKDVNEHVNSWANASGATYVTTNGLGWVSSVIIFFQVGWLIFRNLTTVGTLQGAQFFTGTIFSELSGITYNWQELRSVEPVFVKIFNKSSLHNLSFAHTQPGQVPSPLVRLSRAIAVESVTYSYEPSHPVLNNISCTFSTGSKTVITGDSGKGKSTLLKILSHQITDYTGEVKYDDVDYRSITANQLYTQLYFIEQNPYIFNETIAWNITLGRDGDDAAARLSNVIRATGLTDLIRTLPENGNTVLTSGGENISGGQKQRIALARALFAGRSIILMDEGTSALDKQASRSLEDYLIGLSDVTVIMVTHHLSEHLAKSADQVFTIDSLGN